ncbi:MAG: ABC transporter permease [Opitutus sp.]|nr:ABC transporter permease [Opitutus sp.]
MSTGSFSVRRAWLIAENTLREAVRQKIIGLFLGLALALVIGARWFRDFNFGAPELKFLADCGLGAMTFFGAALTITATAQLFCGEIENRTVLTLLAKPVRRGEFVVGKYLGLLALVGAFCVLLTGALAVVLWWREGELMREFPASFASGRVVSYAGVVTAGFLQWLKLGVLAGFTLLIASFAQTQLFAVVSGFFILVICHLQYLAQEVYARSGSGLARAVGGGLGLLFPNFNVFTLADSFVGTAASSWIQVTRLGIYGFGYIGVTGALAVFSFQRREI